MGTIIVIIGAVLIALIVGIGTYYKRKLRKQYQKQPYQSVTGTDLEAELKGEDAYKHYKRRQDRLTMLITALCAAVVIMGGLVYASVNWWQESEPERIARAEQKRIEKVEKQRLQKEAASRLDNLPVIKDVNRFSKQGMYARFVEYKTKNKIQEISFEKWIIKQSYIYELVLFVIFFGLCLWNYEKKSFQTFLLSCLGVGMAFLFGGWYLGVWFNIGFWLACCGVLMGGGLLFLSRFLGLFIDRVLCFCIGTILLAFSLGFFCDFCVKA